MDQFDHWKDKWANRGLIALIALLLVALGFLLGKIGIPGLPVESGLDNYSRGYMDGVDDMNKKWYDKIKEEPAYMHGYEWGRHDMYAEMKGETQRTYEHARR